MKKLILFAVILLFSISCSESVLGPNELGGETNIELTKKGNEYGFSMEVLGAGSGVFNDIKDSIFISKNDKGVVTISGKLEFGEMQTKAFDTLMGTYVLPDNIKFALMDKYLNRFGAKIDTSDKENMRLDITLKGKVTSDGIQDYMYSKGDVSKPFTLVKYDAKIGDKYEFTTADGEKITRTVKAVQTTEDWDLSFWSVKTIRVEEVQNNDEALNSITWIANHKFGLVGAILSLKNGKTVELTFLPWAML